MRNEFLCIGITLPDPSDDVKKEAVAITRFLQSGVIDFFHIRKPSATINVYKDLIDRIPTSLHSKLVIDNYPELVKKENIGGFHLKSSNKIHSFPEMLKEVFLTRSCHSLEEITEDDKKMYRYRFLSPIFNSISKAGYASKFDLDDENLKKGITNRNIVALGGVEPRHYIKLNESKFVGAALLGYLWQSKMTTDEIITALRAARN